MNFIVIVDFGKFHFSDVYPLSECASRAVSVYHNKYNKSSIKTWPKLGWLDGPYKQLTTFISGTYVYILYKAAASTECVYYEDDDTGYTYHQPLKKIQTFSRPNKAHYYSTMPRHWQPS